MKKIFFVVIILLLIPSVSFSQEPAGINKTDAQGKKQGSWVKRDSSGTILYEGTFRDNHPVGEFRRYYADKTLLSLLLYSSDGRTADATMYYPNKFTASQGKYVDQKKEGKWKFFSSSTEGYLINEEMYKGNRKNGLSVKYFPDSTIAERVNYINDSREGEWTQYFENGKLLLRTTYSGNLLNGKFETWYDNGKLYLTGFYKNNRRDGKWTIYKKDGSVKYVLTYVDGMTSDKQMDIDDINFFEEIEKTKGSIPDPAKTGVIR
jgi:antitoxin component YwqK of YwqJK toxin-antitoxin module